jgi:type II restriction/modification system DNA methylase subunit YeeA
VTPAEFVTTWRASKLKERSASHSHFNQLCELLNVSQPVIVDPTGESYTFERPVKKLTGSKGFADVWKRGAFAWEYKGKHKDLSEAYLQLLIYRDDLENPPLLVVCDMETIQVHTNFTGTNKVVEIWALEDLFVDSKREKLRKVWTDPYSFDPTKDRIAVTEATITQLLNIADSLKQRENNPDKTAHFLVKCVFTLFAEDMDLLPRNGFTQLLTAAKEQSALFKPMAEQLFALMSEGGISILGRIPRFNGQVFSDGEAPDLNRREIDYLLDAATQNWKNVSPAIFGTLFERIIDPRKRAQIGAHYTPPSDILDVIEPVIFEPLRQEWQVVRTEIEPLIAQGQTENTQTQSNELQALVFHQETPLWHHARAEAKTKLEAFQNRLANVTVLDPACGSGNFLYMTLRLLLDLENEVRATIRLLDPGRNVPGYNVPVKVSPRQMRGMELNRYAHEIAGMVLWIGFIQWCAEHGERVDQEPILEKLVGIENRDAALDEVIGKPAEWGEAEFIVGNPPFLGDKKMRQELGDKYTTDLRAAYQDKVPGGADLVCYWFEKARENIETGRTKRAGLIATNSIRGGANRKVLERIAETGGIFAAWSDREWTQDGAAVRVSVVEFDNGLEKSRTLDGKPVSSINPDLTSHANVSQAKTLTENLGVAFIGVQPGGSFDIPKKQALEWLDLPNPDGLSNSDVLKFFLGGRDITDDSSERFIIDFNQMNFEQANQYIAPFAFVEAEIKPIRDKNKDKSSREKWWTHQRSRPEFRKAIDQMPRYMATVRHMKHRIFIWVDSDVIPDSALTVIASYSITMFAVLNSSVHILWAVRMGTFLGVGNDSRYTPTTCFETFPFPHPDPTQCAAIEKAAIYLEQCRAHLKGKGKTLTEAYNALEDCRKKPSPTHEAYTLMDAHERLDKTVYAAYGWTYPLSEDDILEKLLALNLERAALQGENTTSSVESEPEN